MMMEAADLEDQTFDSGSVRRQLGNNDICAENVLTERKLNLIKLIHEGANRPSCSNSEDAIVDSVAFRGLFRDYQHLCGGDLGGLRIVYEKEGMGKSRALQAVARAKSVLQPHRFLIINIRTSSMTCDELYEYIQGQLGLTDLGLSPWDVTEVVRYGLLGPVEPGKPPPKLPATNNGRRIDVAFQHLNVAKKGDFPMLVIDEFNPIDFADSDWTDGEDYTLKQFCVLNFFSHLTGLAHTPGGFVVFLGTRSKAVAQALLKIDNGTKAVLTECTKRNIDGRRMADWRGFDWIAAEKEHLYHLCMNKSTNKN